MSPATREWKGTTYGNSWMHRSLVASIRVLGVVMLYLFCTLFVVPAVFLTSSSRKHIYALFRRRLGLSVFGSIAKTYANFCCFSYSVIDKFAMYGGKKFKIDVQGYEHFLAVAEKPDGFVQLSSHLGNYEIAGYTLVARHKRFNAVVFGGEKATVMASRSKLFSGTNVRMIPIGPDTGYLFMIDSALSAGETVSISADRVSAGSKVVVQPLLGAEARFPAGPFSIAAMRGVDVICVHVIKTSVKRYKVIVEAFDYDKTAPRREQIKELSAQYAACLERLLREHPCQWYNYFDFWAPESVN